MTNRSAVCLFAAAASAALCGPASAQMALNDGDTVVFLGNGVTQQHQFTWMTEAFLRLRYPERKIHFLNLGHVGDTAEKVADKLKDEVLVHKPTVAVVSFGLYEGNFQPFDRPLYTKFKENLGRLLDALAAAKVRVILCTPTPVDPARKWQDRDLKNYNEAMLKYADHCRRIAGERKLPFADLMAPLLAAEEKGRHTNPKWSVYDEKIPILLTPQGHLVAAAQVLKALAAHDQVGHVAGELKGEELSFSDVRTGGEQGPRQTVKWSPTSGAILPLRDVRRPVALFAFSGVANARAVAKAVGSADRMNELAVRLTGLPPGDYHLRLDGRPIGTFSAAELAGEVRLIERAGPAARNVLDDDLDRVWAGVALKDGLNLKRLDPANKNDRGRLDKEFSEVVHRLDEMNRELAQPMRLAVLPGFRNPDPKAGPPTIALKPGEFVRHLLGDRYYALYLPKDYTGSTPLPLLIWLHPDRSAPEPFEKFFRTIAEQKKVIVALPCSWNSEWRGEDDCGFLLDQVIKPLCSRLKPEPSQVFLAGHGRGAVLSCELGLANSELIRGVIAVAAGPLPEKLPAPKLKGYPIVLIHGNNDPVTPVSIAAAAEEQLRKLGCNVVLRKHDKERRIPDGSIDEALKFLLENPAKP